MRVTAIFVSLAGLVDGKGESLLSRTSPGSSSVNAHAERSRPEDSYVQLAEVVKSIAGNMVVLNKDQWNHLIKFLQQVRLLMGDVGRNILSLVYNSKDVIAPTFLKMLPHLNPVLAMLGYDVEEQKPSHEPEGSENGGKLDQQLFKSLAEDMKTVEKNDWKILDETLVLLKNIGRDILKVGEQWNVKFTALFQLLPHFNELLKEAMDVLKIPAQRLAQAYARMSSDEKEKSGKGLFKLTKTAMKSLQKNISTEAQAKRFIKSFTHDLLGKLMVKCAIFSMPKM